MSVQELDLEIAAAERHVSELKIQREQEVMKAAAETEKAREAADGGTASQPLMF